MKLRMLAIAAAALLSTQAHALQPTAFAAATKVYFSGATATTNAFGALFTQNCAAGTRDDYTLTGNAGFSTIYTCTLNATNDFGVGAINIVFQKLNAGGSGAGVYPVSNNAPVTFIDETTCNGTTKLCTGQKPVIPDGGISDLNLEVFNAAVNKPAEFATASVGTNWVESANAAGIPGASYVQTVFGLGVSGPLYAALQADQGTTGVPTVSPAAVAQIIAKNYAFDVLGWKPLLPNSAAAVTSKSITICRRVNGSGTQAAANAFFLNYPFYSPTIEPANTGDTAPGQYIVDAQSESSGVRTCLLNAGTAGNYAIGHLSLESDDTSSTWKFVRIGNQTPGTAFARDGRYNYMYDSVCGYNGAKPASTTKTIARLICAGSSSPANLNALTPAQQRGIMGSPASVGCSADPTNARCSSVWRNNGNAANPVGAF